MKVEGYNDNQGRPIYQPRVVDQNGRALGCEDTGEFLNPLTGKGNPTAPSRVAAQKRAEGAFTNLNGFPDAGYERYDGTFQRSSNWSVHG